MTCYYTQPTKFEGSRCTCYEAMNGGAKCRIWGWFGVVRGHPKSWAMSPFDRAHTTSYSTLIETVRVSCTIVEITNYLSTVADFDPPHMRLAPPQGLSPVEFR